jgi:7-alpha-hydroxysteroid dehydrogenase
VTTLSAFLLKGRVALITGGGRGIGESIARAFADAGAAVALVARTAAEVHAVAADVQAAGGSALALRADINDLGQLPGLIEQTVGKLGGLDVVVNNAGGGFEWRQFSDMRVEQLEGAFHFNVAAPFELCRLAVPHLLDRPGASIINIASTTVGKALRGHLVYDVAKAALTQMTRSLAADLGPRIRVNAILPNAVETPALRRALDAQPPDLRQSMIEHTRLRRNGTPADIANAALYLASPAASWVTGTLLDVNGGPVDEIRPMFPDL